MGAGPLLFVLCNWKGFSAGCRAKGALGGWHERQGREPEKVCPAFSS